MRHEVYVIPSTQTSDNRAVTTIIVLHKICPTGNNIIELVSKNKILLQDFVLPQHLF